MKNNILFLATLVLFLALSSCNKEEPQPTSAAFTTNIQNNTLEYRQNFTVYMSEAEGEFLTYFKGDRETATYGTGFGTPVDIGSDSLLITPYNMEGTFTFTLVATSYGNWGETVSQDVQSIDITVLPLPE